MSQTEQLSKYQYNESNLEYFSILSTTTLEWHKTTAGLYIVDYKTKVEQWVKRYRGNMVVLVNAGCWFTLKINITMDHEWKKTYLAHAQLYLNTLNGITISNHDTNLKECQMTK